METSRTVTRFGAALLTMAAAGGAQAAEGGSMIFRDWIAGCDNTRRCTALSLPGEADSAFAYLKLQRSGGPADRPVLSLNIRDAKLKPSFKVRLILDGAPMPTAGRDLPGSSADQEIGTVEIPEKDAEALIAATRKAAKLGIALDGRRYTLSLAGAVAALLWLDEQQQRLGTSTALIRKGDKSVTTIPSAPTLPVLEARATSGAPALDSKAAARLAKELRAHLKSSAPDSCEDDDGSPASDKVWALDARTNLVGLLCARGAYNFISGYWIVEQGKVAAARRLAFPKPSGKPQEQLVNADYDPATGKLDFFDKGRGIGDCGAAGSYVWTGKAFALANWSEMSTCRGLTADDWITLFRSEVKVVK